jgi:homoserine dehydrogenase
MTSNKSEFASALADAQRLGYAEADPTLDIDGFDTAHKLCLLIRLAWGVDYPTAKMPIRGIRNMDSMDIEVAREFGYRIKLLGHARMTDQGLDAGVFPVLVRHTYLLARVGGAFNAIRLDANALGPLFLHGQGAGALPTGSAVMSDIIAAARGTMPFNSGFVDPTPQPAQIMPAGESVSMYYVRFMVKDNPGVLHTLTGALAKRGVSIAQAIQKSECDGGVPLILMLHAAREKDVNDALEAIKQTNHLRAEPVAFRVMA